MPGLNEWMNWHPNFDTFDGTFGNCSSDVWWIASTNTSFTKVGNPNDSSHWSLVPILFFTNWTTLFEKTVVCSLCCNSATFRRLLLGLWCCFSIRTSKHTTVRNVESVMALQYKIGYLWFDASISLLLALNPTERNSCAILCHIFPCLENET